MHHTQREAGLALGLSRWETVLHVVIPEALPGIVTGIVLASGRILVKLSFNLHSWSVCTSS